MYPMVDQGVYGFISNTTLKVVGSIAHRVQLILLGYTCYPFFTNTNKCQDPCDL